MLSGQRSAAIVEHQTLSSQRSRVAAARFHAITARVASAPAHVFVCVRARAQTSE